MYTILVFSHMVDRFATMKNSISISKSTPSSKIVNTPLPPVPITSTSSFTQTVNCQPSTSIVPCEILKWFYLCLITVNQNWEFRYRIVGEKTRPVLYSNSILKQYFSIPLLLPSKNHDQDLISWIVDVVQSTNHRRKGYFYCLNSVLLILLFVSSKFVICIKVNGLLFATLR